MIFTPRIRSAIQFSLMVHEVDQKQKRKGKDIPYITHPLIVGLILARAGASEDVIIAGILHDTVEDSIPHKKVSGVMIAEQFGEAVAKLVASVTELPAETPWEDRKQEALGHIATFSHDALLVKSADLISNTSDLVADHAAEGDATFERFHASKERFIEHYVQAISAILEKWPENPLAEDLHGLSEALRLM